jgi:hypothetical protein
MSRLISAAFTLWSRETAAMVRTTTAVVNMIAGVADNVLPQQGAVRFNIRSHPSTLFQTVFCLWLQSTFKLFYILTNIAFTNFYALSAVLLGI